MTDEVLLEKMPNGLHSFIETHHEIAYHLGFAVERCICHALGSSQLIHSVLEDRSQSTMDWLRETSMAWAFEFEEETVQSPLDEDFIERIDNFLTRKLYKPLPEEN